MRLSCLQENLKRGLAMVNHAISPRSPLPILANVLLATDSGRLRLAATDLESGITCWVGAKVDEEGAVTIPAKLFNDVVNNLPNDRVTLTLDARTQTVLVECGRYKTNIKGIDAEEFPPIPNATEEEPTFTVAPDQLQHAIQQVAFAAASDESRPVLTGVLMRLRDNQVTMAAADGYRLAIRTLNLPIGAINPAPALTEFIVPARALADLARILSDDGGAVAVTVTSGGRQVMFHNEMVNVVLRLLDGKFPDFERIIPTVYTTRSMLDTAEVLKAVKLAALFATSSQNIVKLSFEPGDDLGPGKLVISANATEVGDNQGEMDGLVHGEVSQIAMNVRFLSEALTAIKVAQVAVEMQGPQSPGVFKPVGQDSYVHIIMPMTIR
ncbi:MAG: DNA polymerase III subunit beta [Chloroflexaceae bacterium]|nr:DNA polymerase III subunit beta [Chloroflexaceae bacterium]